MKKQNDEIKNRAANYWQELANRYFEADLTDKEESALMRFVASDESAEPHLGEEALQLFDEVRATMSLTAVGRKATKKEVSTSRRATIQKWIYVAAASIAVVLTVGGLHIIRNSSGNEDIYVAYLDGEVITDKEQVLELMHETWNDIDIHSSEDEVELQMKEMFEGLE